MPRSQLIGSNWSMGPSGHVTSATQDVGAAVHDGDGILGPPMMPYKLLSNTDYMASTTVLSPLPIGHRKYLRREVLRRCTPANLQNLASIDAKTK
jgi:hypothetical protein